jgi:beta-lactamase superfamily II metal-dependent hydrolase
MRPLIIVFLAASCAHQEPAPPPPVVKNGQCGNGKPLTVRFYNVGQALAAMIDLPDGKHILVDSGDIRNEAGVKHLIDGLRRDLHGDRIDALWVTHQHSDHQGGVPDVLDSGIKVDRYIDNGTPGSASSANEVKKARDKAKQHGVPICVADLQNRTPPLPASHLYTVKAIIPSVWGGNCKTEPNDCSIGLRVDYCGASVLFVGDAEEDEEKKLNTGGHATLLQVGHHGSYTSSSEEFLKRVSPVYAVISAGLPNKGTNATYCHPVEATLMRLTKFLGHSESTRQIQGFFGKKCEAPFKDQWRPVAASKRLFATEVDGDVVLQTFGNDEFTRVMPATSSAAD